MSGLRAKHCALSVVGYLRSLRVEKQMKQSELAARLGVVQSLISKWERGANCPGREHLQKLSEIFGVDPVRLRSRVLRAGRRWARCDLQTEMISAPREFWALLRSAAHLHGEDPEAFLVEIAMDYIKLTELRERYKESA